MSKQSGTHVIMQLPQMMELAAQRKSRNNNLRNHDLTVLRWRELLGEELSFNLINEVHVLIPEVKKEFKKERDKKQKGVYAHARRNKLTRAASTAT